VDILLNVIFIIILISFILVTFSSQGDGIVLSDVSTEVVRPNSVKDWYGGEIPLPLPLSFSSSYLCRLSETTWVDLCKLCKAVPKFKELMMFFIQQLDEWKAYHF
jgi:hypothetical protein